MWLTLPADMDAHAVLVAARKRGVSFIGVTEHAELVAQEEAALQRLCERGGVTMPPPKARGGVNYA